EAKINALKVDSNEWKVTETIEYIEGRVIEAVEFIRAVIIILALLWFAAMFCWKIYRLLV
ncbi:hypothetical protein Tco_1461107, partial [Tanacetum coccineum]